MGKASESTAGKRRGQFISTQGGGCGRYVGTTASGQVWVAYEAADFAPMCAAFDARGGR